MGLQKILGIIYFAFRSLVLALIELLKGGGRGGRRASPKPNPIGGKLDPILQMPAIILAQKVLPHLPN